VVKIVLGSLFTAAHHAYVWSYHYLQYAEWFTVDVLSDEKHGWLPKIFEPGLGKWKKNYVRVWMTKSGA